MLISAPRKLCTRSSSPQLARAVVECNGDIRTPSCPTRAISCSWALEEQQDHASAHRRMGGARLLDVRTVDRWSLCRDRPRVYLRACSQTRSARVRQIVGVQQHWGNSYGDEHWPARRCRRESPTRLRQLCISAPGARFHLTLHVTQEES